MGDCVAGDAVHCPWSYDHGDGRAWLGVADGAHDRAFVFVLDLRCTLIGAYFAACDPVLVETLHDSPPSPPPPSPPPSRRPWRSRQMATTVDSHRPAADEGAVVIAGAQFTLRGQWRHTAEAPVWRWPTIRQLLCACSSPSRLPKAALPPPPPRRSVDDFTPDGDKQTEEKEPCGASAAPTKRLFPVAHGHGFLLDDAPRPARCYRRLAFRRRSWRRRRRPPPTATAKGGGGGGGGGAHPQ